MFTDLINTIGHGIFTAFFTFTAKLPLLLIRAIARIFQLIAVELPQYLLFGIKPGESFSSGHVPELFMRMSIIAIVVFVIFFTVGILRAGVYKENQNNPIKIVLKYSIIATFWITILPLALYAISLGFNAVLNLMLGSETRTLDRQIWNGLYSGTEYPKIPFERWDRIGADYNFDFDTWMLLDNGQGPMLWFITLIINFATLIPLVLGGLTLIQKVFQQFVLFILAPFVAASALVDEGRRMKLWQEQYITKGITILAFVVSIQIFGTFINLSTHWVNTLKEDFFTKFALLVVICAGGAVAAMGMSSLVASFVGESASVRETMSETKGLIASGMSMFSAAKKAGALGKKVASGAGKIAKTGLSKSASFLSNKLPQASKLKASASLLGKRLSGKISRDEYKHKKVELNDAFNNHKESMLQSKNDWNTAQKDFLSQGGDRKWLSASTNQLISQESDLDLKLNDISKSYGKDSQEYKDTLNQKMMISNLLDSKINRESSRSFSNSDKIKKQFNEKRVGAMTRDQIDAIAKQKRYEAYKNRGNKTASEFMNSKEYQSINKEYQNNLEKNKSASKDLSNRKKELDKITKIK